jgi:hypothetical protein
MAGVVELGMDEEDADDDDDEEEVVLASVEGGCCVDVCLSFSSTSFSRFRLLATFAFLRSSLRNSSMVLVVVWGGDGWLWGREGVSVSWGRGRSERDDAIVAFNRRRRRRRALSGGTGCWTGCVEVATEACRVMGIGSNLK